MFELYARLSYTQRISDLSEEGEVVLPLAQSLHEKKYFGYAAKLFAKCSEQRGIKFDLSLDAFRNYVSAGLYDEAAELITSGKLATNEENFLAVYGMCVLKGDPLEPTAPFRKDFKHKTEKARPILDAVKAAMMDY